MLVKGYPWRAAGTRRFEDPDRELRAHGEGDEGEPLFHLPGAGPPTELFMPISDEAGRYLRLRPAAGTVRPGDGG